VGSQWMTLACGLLLWVRVRPRAGVSVVPAGGVH